MSTGKLSKEDLEGVSGKCWKDQQESWFRSEGIPCKRNAKGELVVCWVHVHRWLEGRPSVRSAEPDFSSLGG